MPGPAPRSNQHKKTVGSNKIHTGEDIAPPLLDKVPAVPAILKGKRYAQAEWKRVCKLLIEEQILTRWDLATIKVMCLEWERYCLACDDIDQNGEFMVTHSGYEQVRPVHTIRNKAFGNYEKLLQRTGADVVSRAKMKRIRPPEKKGGRFDAL